jgi:hypothetical protein
MIVSATQLTVAVTNLTVGPVTAVVKSSSVSSGTAVQVATVIPAITPSTASLTANATSATSITIKGFGFSTTPANNVVTFTNSQGTTFTGTVTASTATQLTVTLSGLSVRLPAGALDASVNTTIAGLLYTSLTEEVANVP